ncbi:hypothetical protein RRG08_063942 [Elysia crispata]|uniref:Uncharacterized protein n=1 Tax=Elysia crispata TaxID=231223 RepID=A0AAE0YG90_9GAST|nr:hypothetical protein RRG08_063942 [Elysia crispata]
MARTARSTVYQEDAMSRGATFKEGLGLMRCYYSSLLYHPNPRGKRRTPSVRQQQLDRYGAMIHRGTVQTFDDI